MKSRRISLSTTIAALFAMPQRSLFIEGETPAQTETPGAPSTPPSTPAPKTGGKKNKGFKPTKAAKKAKVAKPAKTKKAKAPKKAQSIADSTEMLREKAKSDYVKPKGVKTAGGNQAVDNGDKVAKALRGMSIDQVYKAAASALKEPESALRAKYKHLNEGMQRMNLGNRMRAA